MRQRLAPGNYPLTSEATDPFDAHPEGSTLFDPHDNVPRAFDRHFEPLGFGQLRDCSTGRLCDL